YWTKSNSFKKQLDQVMMNQAQPSLRVPWLLNFQLIYPLKLQEQTAIATALSDIDALIGELDKLIAKKQGIKQATMQQLLTGKKRLAGFGSTSKYKQTEIGIIPEDWEVETLRNIAYFTNGKGHEQFINETGNYIVINSKFVSTEGKVFKKSVSALALLETGDIAMVMSDIPNGKALAKCFFVDENNKYTLNQRICSIKSSACNNIFLFWKLNRNKYFLAFDSGSGQTNLKKKEVLDCPIAIPPTIEEQTAIANILSDMDAEISQLEGRRAKMGELKQGMMQELLTGRIRLNTQDSTRC
ncbi:MAG: hypothetical protein RL755_2021, partial [Pseudomonadota bacterium]